MLFHNESIKKNYDVVVVDTETTGLHAGDDELLQVSILGGDGSVLYNSYIKPQRHTSWSEVERIHHISAEKVKEAPTIDTEIGRISEILHKAQTIVGYNVGFDLQFLYAAGFRLGEHQYVDDVMLAFAEIYGDWNARHNSYRWQKLETCAAYYGYNWSKEAQHNSLEDCRATLHCYKCMNKNSAKAAEDKSKSGGKI